MLIILKDVCQLLVLGSFLIVLLNYVLDYDYIACRVPKALLQDNFMPLYMPPSAPTAIAQSMDNVLNLSLSPSLQILPNTDTSICVTGRRWATEKVDSRSRCWVDN